MHKIILHCHNPENLHRMARAAKYWIEADIEEGDWPTLQYSWQELTGETKKVRFSAIKRKTCITIYDDEEAQTND